MVCILETHFIRSVEVVPGQERYSLLPIFPNMSNPDEMAVLRDFHFTQQASISICKTIVYYTAGGGGVKESLQKGSGGRAPFSVLSRM
jgi:ribosomal protein L16 Arg81 hydroxylase